MNLELKQQLVEYLTKNNFSRNDESWVDIYLKFPVKGNLSRGAAGDYVRGCARVLKRQQELNEEIAYQTSQGHDLPITEKDNLVLKSKWQGPGGEWRYSYTNQKDGGMSKESYQEIISSLDFKHCKVKTSNVKQSNNQLLVFTDQHLGMSAEGNIFDLDWNLEEYYKRLDIFIGEVEENTNVTIAMLGDFTDGLNSKTARGGHTLQQNMSDKEMFKYGIESMIYLLDNVSKICKGNVEVKFITNSNHPGVTDYNIGLSMHHLCKDRYGVNVKFDVLEKFVTRIVMEGNTILLTHGYDEKHLMKGFPRFLTTAHINKLRTIIDHYGDKYPIVLRGDLHQYTDIDYVFFRDIICPAFSNPSGWVSMNFASPNKGGFLSCTFENTIPKFKYVRF